MPRPSRWDDVVAAAARVFSEKGFGGASLEDVANEVGMLKGSLYNYIRTKEDLLFAVVRPAAEHLLDRARELAETDLPASEKVRQIAQLHVGVIDQFLPYVSVYVQEIAGKGAYPEWSRMDREYAALVERIIRDGIDDGVFAAELDPRTAALTMIGSFNWLTRWHEPGDALRARAIAGQMAEFFLAGALRRSGG